MTNVMHDGPLPSSPDAERAVLGAILINNSAWYRVPNLSADQFHNDAHRFIYETIALMVAEGVADIEPLTLKEWIARNPQQHGRGVDVVMISGLLDQVPDVANIERYAAIIKRYAEKRAQIKAGYRLVSDAYDPECEPEEAAASVIAAVSEQATAKADQAVHIYDGMSGTVAHMEALAAEDKSIALTSGFAILDEHKVFTPTFVLWGGATKSGKSGTMGNLARGLALNGHGSLVATLESQPRELHLRWASMVTGIPHSYLRDWRTLNEANRARVCECLAEAKRLNVHMSRGPRTVEGIIMEARRLKATKDIGCVFIDYVQLLDTRRHIANREERLSYIGDALLTAAGDIGVTIFGLSQLNEDRAETRQDGLVQISDIAFSKQLAKSARIVVLAQPDPTVKDCYLRVRIAANNEERTHDGFEAHFEKRYQRFGEGDCHANNCHTVSGGTARQLF